MEKFKQLLLSAICATIPWGISAQTIFTCGDSTMADYATDGSTPTRGWGQYFGTFFDSDITVINRGKGGMDVQGFYNGAAYWPTIKKSLKPGDYVLLQFAHNDEKNGGMDGQQLYDYYIGIGDTQTAATVDTRGSIPNDTYVKTLRKLVEETRALDAIPLFASSVCRMNFTSDGDIRRAARHDLGDSFSKLTADGPTTGNKISADDHSMDFRWQMEQLALEMTVPFIDLTEASRELFVKYGDAKTHELLSDGQGSTHLSVAGAALIARRCAEIMSDKGILADHINVSDAGLSISPTSGNLGEAYVGNVLNKEFTITGFGLSPESGNVTITSDGVFDISTDKVRWSKSIQLPYDGGTIIGTFYVKASLKNPGELSGTLTASASNSSINIPVSATGLAIPGSGALSLVWPLQTGNEYDLDGDINVVAMNIHGLEVVEYNNGINLVPTGGVWPDGDIDESPTRYIEFGITVSDGKTVRISGMSMSIGGIATDAMQCHVSYSAISGFGDPHTFYSPAAMAMGVMNEVSTRDIINLSAGETLLLRVYPWTKTGVADAPIRISDVTINGYIANESTEANILWTLDKGKDNPTVGDTTSDAFAFTGYSVGKDLTVAGTGKPADRTGTMYQPAISNQSSYTDAASIEFTLRPKAGITFQPRKVSFYATRNGTNGGNVEASLELDGTKKIIGTKLEPIRNNVAPNEKLFEFDIDGVVVYNNTLTLRLAIAALADNKTMTIHDVSITGDISGEEIEVPAYAITVTPSIEDAGTVTISPNTSVIDENVAVTVSATENFGYRFIGWSADGTVVATDNPYTFPASRDMNLIAVYEKLTIYPLELTINGGANNYMIEVVPEGHLIDGIRYYESGTDVVLTARNNRILTFTNWEDGTTSSNREIAMDGEKSVIAEYSADEFIVGWDFYYDEPGAERSADFRAESDNAGLLSLHNENGETSSWLPRGISRGDENGRYAARIWKMRTSKLFYEASFSTKEYSNIKIASALSCSYNTYSRFFVQYSLDGKNYSTLGEMSPGNRTWTEAEFPLPSDADNQTRVYVRWYPDFEAPLVGNDTDYDGLAITDIFVLADNVAGDDKEAPVLTASIPANESTGASVNGSVVLTYNEKIQIGNGEASLNGTSLSPSISGKSVIFRYSGLSYGTSYKFSLPAGAITDRSGNEAEAVDITFTTMERMQPEARMFDAIVDINGNGDYTSLQTAIDEAPAGRVKPWLIFVKNGNYNEHIDIPSNKPFIHITGQDRDKTIILDDRLSGGDNAVHVSIGATVVINSDDCFFENITIENSYGHEQQNGPQALALNTSGDRAIFNNVALLSYQDTWITPGKSAYRAYVKNSLIEGAVDFIYNSGDIYVENTTLLITRKSGGFIVAPSHAEDVKWGYVFRDCTITAPGDPSQTSVWLGRPWHNSPKTVFLNTRAEVTIPATGWYETMGGLPVIWAEWNTTDANGNLLDLSQRRDTYYYVKDGERVYGKAKNILTDGEAAQYTVSNVLSGSDSWQPAIKTESCSAPAPVINGQNIEWDAVPYAICYIVADGDNIIEITTSTSISLPDLNTNNISVQAVNEFGGLSAKGIAEVETSGMESIDLNAYKIIAIYDVYGHSLTEAVPGINIVHYLSAEGTLKVKKVFVR